MGERGEGVWRERWWREGERDLYLKYLFDTDINYVLNNRVNVLSYEKFLCVSRL